MIQNIFLPEKIKSYSLFSKRIAGIDIHKGYIYATVIRIGGSVSIIEKIIEVPISPAPAIPFDERLSEALKELALALKKIDEYRVTISSSQVVFKSLRLPFVSHEKIKMVVGFEVEPLLPFPLSEAVVDFIIVETAPDLQSAQVLVVAVQKSVLASHMAILESAGIRPAAVIVDMFALYGLYNMIPKYAHNQQAVTLIDLGLSSTQIGYLYQGKLKGIRSIPGGITQLAKKIGADSGAGSNEILESLLRAGISRSEQGGPDQAIKSNVAQFLQTIQFTLASFAARAQDEENKGHILLVGQGSTITGLPEMIAEVTNQTCELFDTSLIKENPAIKLAENISIPSAAAVALGCALSSQTLPDFNVLRGSFEKADQGLLIKQLVVGSVLLVALFAILMTHLFMQTRALSNELEESQNEVLTELKARFRRIEGNTNDIEEAVEEARQELKQEQDTWSKFYDQAQSSYLQYLLELTNRIDAKALGFEIERLNLSDNTLIIKARVKDHPSLSKLEDELRQSGIFSFENQTDPDFEMRITITRKPGESL